MITTSSTPRRAPWVWLLALASACGEGGVQYTEDASTAAPVEDASTEEPVDSGVLADSGPEEPDAGQPDADASRPSGVGAITVRVEAVDLGLLVADVHLGAQAIEVHGDRGPEYSAHIALAGPLDITPAIALSVSDGIPATYGELSFVGVASLAITTTLGLTLELDLSPLGSITERCEGAGAYLAYGGRIEVDARIGLGATLNALLLNGLWPPLLSGLVSGVGVDELLGDIEVVCRELR